MSYVGPPFEHDIFISYGRGDEHGTIPSGMDEWSAAFAAHLQKHLLEHKRFREDPKRRVSVYFDAAKAPGQGVSGLAHLTPQLQGAAEGAAMLTILMSLDYLDSTWCEQERNWWRDKQLALAESPDKRISVAKIVPTGKTEWPDLLQDSSRQPLPGFLFYDTTLPEKTALPFGFPAPNPGVEPYRDVFFKLVTALWNQLDEMRERLDRRKAQEDDVARLASSNPKVYLHGSELRRKAWEKAHDTLSNDGFEVWPASPDPFLRDPQAQDDLFRERVQIVGDCDALLLIGTPDEPALDSDLYNYGRRVRESARARGERSLPCGLLNTVGPAIETDRRRRLTTTTSVDWIDGTLDPWTPNLRTWLASKSAEAQGAI
jgi:hypothetical protein